MPDETEDIKIKKVKGRIKVYKVTPYKDAMIYIRQINDDIFEYLVARGNQIYGDYVVILPQEGRAHLNQAEKFSAFSLIFTAATTTVDTLRGEGVQGEQKSEAQAVVDVFFPPDKTKKQLVN